ncbi:MAG: Flp pilus assembly protein CpaB, partial [Gammaproteobacteria bacterium]
MARKRGLILIMLSMVVGLAAAWTANRWVDQRTATDDDSAKGTRVVVAALAIPYATKVEARHVKYVQLPEDTAPANAFTSIEDVEGRVSTLAVERGEILLADRFAEHESGSTLAALVSENMRAVTVRVNDVVGVAGFLLPGNRVDVVSARRLQGSSRQAIAET